MKRLSKEGKLSGWSINKDENRRSYPEKFFIKLMEMNDLYSKYTIKEKLSFGKYFLDFAFLEIKVDIEIDGQQHFITESAINYDIERDKFLLDNDWCVYRISWVELKSDPKKVIIDMLNWLSDKGVYRKYDINDLYKTKEEKVEMIKKSNIDFSRQGWVKAVSKIIGINENKGGLWMEKNMNDFYKMMCWKRKRNAPII